MSWTDSSKCSICWFLSGFWEILYEYNQKCFWRITNPNYMAFMVSTLQQLPQSTFYGTVGHKLRKKLVWGLCPLNYWATAADTNGFSTHTTNPIQQAMAGCHRKPESQVRFIFFSFSGDALWSELFSLLCLWLKKDYLDFGGETFLPPTRVRIIFLLGLSEEHYVVL